MPLFLTPCRRLGSLLKPNQIRASAKLPLLLPNYTHQIEPLFSAYLIVNTCALPTAYNLLTPPTTKTFTAASWLVLPKDTASADLFLPPHTAANTAKVQIPECHKLYCS